MGSEKGRLDQLTSIRGIAAWWVVLFHSQLFLGEMLSPSVRTFVSFGFLAVDLFFILSGFVIYLNYYSRVDAQNPKSIITFYWNRFARIYPLHFVMLLGYLALAVSFFYFSSSGRPPESYGARSFLESLFLVQTWGNGYLTWNVPSWSISSEWTVYLVFPLIAVVFSKYIATPVRLVTISILAFALLVYRFKSSEVVSIGDNIIEMALTRTFFEFLLGCVIGSLYVNYRNLLVKVRYPAIVLFLVCSGVFMVYRFNDYFVIPVAFFCLILFLSVDDSFVSRLLSNRVLVYLGEISYSTYMVHYFIYDLLKAGWGNIYNSVGYVELAASLVTVLLFSVLLHHGVEMPAQRYLRSRVR